MYPGVRPVMWEVTDQAKNSVATLRLLQLARPKGGRNKDDYDPYRVSVSARSANATPRLAELALPIPRKVRQNILPPVWKHRLVDSDRMGRSVFLDARFFRSRVIE